jgi:hypothetical protein
MLSATAFSKLPIVSSIRTVRPERARANTNSATVTTMMSVTG